MAIDVPTLARRKLRGTDNYSLLRLYDLASDSLARPQSQQEGERAVKVVRRIAEELRRRDVLP